MSTNFLGKYNAFMEQVHGGAITLATLKDAIAADNSPEAIREFKQAKNEFFDEVETGLEVLIHDLLKIKALKSDPLLKQINNDVVHFSSQARKPTNR